MLPFCVVYFIRKMLSFSDILLFWYLIWLQTYLESKLGKLLICDISLLRVLNMMFHYVEILIIFPSTVYFVLTNCFTSSYNNDLQRTKYYKLQYKLLICDICPLSVYLSLVVFNGGHQLRSTPQYVWVSGLSFAFGILRAEIGMGVHVKTFWCLTSFLLSCKAKKNPFLKNSNQRVIFVPHFPFCFSWLRSSFSGKLGTISDMTFGIACFCPDIYNIWYNCHIN